MSRWRAFVDVLDEVLSEPVEATITARGSATTSAFRSSPPLYTFAPHLTPNRFWSAPGPHRGSAVSEPGEARSIPRSAQSFPSSGQAHAAAPSNAPVNAEPRMKRLLKPAEETALRTLIRLGAALDDRFTTRELRSAFRVLAQRYHPDRHPGAGDAERMRLGATFAELTSAYGVLLESLPR